MTNRHSKAGASKANSLPIPGLIAIAIMLLASLAVTLDAQASTVDADQHHPMRFDRVSLDEGLSQSNVF